MTNELLKNTLKGLTDPDEIFDLMMFGVWNIGRLGGKIPVTETREIFADIKKRLLLKARREVFTRENRTVIEASLYLFEKKYGQNVTDIVVKLRGLTKVDEKKL